MIESISVHGFRGFQTKQILDLAIPNESAGSGLTILIGPNGGGKSTVVECFRKLSQRDNTSFTEGKRNKAARDRVSIILKFNGSQGELRTVPSGGSETKWEQIKNSGFPKIYFLPSRRVFNPYFSRGQWNREIYSQNVGDFNFRGQSIDTFSHRLFNALEKYEAFTEMFSRVYGRRLDWTIDQNDTGHYYVKIIKSSSITHNSDGLGEGIVSLMFLIDALFESSPEELLVIDEPELSLHPQLQRRLLREIISLTSDRQILITTHSPEMVDIASTLNGAIIARIADEDDGSKIYKIDDDSRSYFRQLDSDLFNPHTLGYDSKSCFFAEDNIIIVEGQEDVVFFKKLEHDLDLNFNIPFWGYGAGGAEKIGMITHILSTLGFKEIGVIYDGDKSDEATRFKTKFPKFPCWILPADDIRDKTGNEGNITKQGIFDTKKCVKAEHKEAVVNLLQEINKFVSGTKTEVEYGEKKESEQRYRAVRSCE